MRDITLMQTDGHPVKINANNIAGVRLDTDQAHTWVFTRDGQAYIVQQNPAEIHNLVCDANSPTP